MLNNLTYKQRNIALLIGVVIALYFVFTNLLKDTFDLKNQCVEVENKLKSADNAPAIIAQLKGEIQQIDKIIGSDNKLDQTFQENILEAVSRYCNKHKMDVYAFNEPLVTISNNYEIETNVVTVSGSFKDILLLVNELEQNKRIAQIVSVQYFSKKDFVANRTDLLATIHFQNIKKI